MLMVDAKSDVVRKSGVVVKQMGWDFESDECQEHEDGNLGAVP